MQIARTSNVSVFIFVLALAATFVSTEAMAATTATLLPTSDGTYASWTPKSGSTHYTMVDESSCNGTTDYVSETTAGERDSYGISLSSVPNGSTITNIAITPCASRNSSGSGSSNMSVFYRLDGVNSADSAAYALTGTTPANLSITNFSGLSIVKSSSSALQIGAVYSSGTKGARLGRIATVITYDPLTIPSAPSGAVAFASSSSVLLFWTDNSTNEDGFKIERRTNGGSYSEIATVGSNVTSYVDTSVVDANTYTYRVRAYNAAGDSAYSTSGDVVYGTLPAAPTSLVADPVSFGTTTVIYVSWTDNASNEANYVVERSTDNVNFSVIATLGSNATSHYDLPASGTYYYQVKATNVVGSSAYSNSDDATI